MIYFYSGTPGSGKSLHVAKDIYTKLFLKKENVIANFDINREMYDKKRRKGKFTYVSNSELSTDFLYQYAKDNHILGKENQTLVVIDECQILFNPRNWSDKYRINWINFFTQHRKWGYNFILISQFDRLVDRQIRSLFEYEIKHRKVNNFKVGQLLPVSTFMAIEYWYGVKEKVSSNMFLYKKKYGRLYDTFKNFDE